MMTVREAYIKCKEILAASKTENETFEAICFFEKRAVQDGVFIGLDQALMFSFLRARPTSLRLTVTSASLLMECSVLTHLL